MQTSKKLGLCAAALVVWCTAAAAPVARAEQVDNPQYTAWSKFAVGSSETIAGELSGAAPNAPKMTTETVRKLIEKTDDHVTVETTATITVMGQQHATPPRNQTFPAKAEPKDIKEVGTEDVPAAGKTFSCKIYEMKVPAGATGPGSQPGAGGGAGAAADGAKAKIWISSDVPGGVVKMEAASSRGTMTQTLKSFEAK